MKYNPQHYLDCSAMESVLRGFLAEFPELLEMEAIGRTLEGRSIWLVTLTNKATGRPLSKPGFWIDGNTHATELASAQACIHVLHEFLKMYSSRSDIRDLIDHQVLYIVPRISPDGAEMALKTPRVLRSSPVPWPQTELLPGLYPDDVNGDGEILTMRIPDPNGPWRVSDLDSRVLRLRKPDEVNDPSIPTFRLVVEGKFLGPTERPPTKVEIAPPRVLYGIDLNRQYPEGWAPEGQQFGAGPAPLSQPESRAVFDAICNRPNIVGAVSFHTFSRVLIRPWTNEPDDKIPFEDLEVWKSLGQRYEEVSGYPAVSAFHGFKYHPREKLFGDFADWAYAQRGIFGWTAEIWHLAQAAGIEIKNHVDWFFRSSEEDACRILKWCDQQLEPGSYFQDWTAFHHPDLGPLEIGGWKTKFTWSNPPGKFLPAELDRMTRLVEANMKANPRVVIQKVQTTRLNSASSTEPLSRIAVSLENVGYLPTYGSEVALTRGVSRKPRLQVKLSGSLRLISGSMDIEIDHLKGRANQGMFQSSIILSLMQVSPPNLCRSEHEWIVEGTGTFHFEARFDRAGAVSKAIEI